jgi:hypothetical protein
VVKGKTIENVLLRPSSAMPQDLAERHLRDFHLDFLNTSVKTIFLVDGDHVGLILDSTLPPQVHVVYFYCSNMTDLRVRKGVTRAQAQGNVNLMKVEVKKESGDNACKMLLMKLLTRNHLERVFIISSDGDFDDSVALTQDERVERMEANGKVNTSEFIRVHSDHGKLLHLDNRSSTSHQNHSAGNSSKRPREEAAMDDRSSKRHNSRRSYSTEAPRTTRSN